MRSAAVPAARLLPGTQPRRVGLEEHQGRPRRPRRCHRSRRPQGQGRVRAAPAAETAPSHPWFLRRLEFAVHHRLIHLLTIPLVRCPGHTVGNLLFVHGSSIATHDHDTRLGGAINGSSRAAWGAWATATVVKGIGCAASGAAVTTTCSPATLLHLGDTHCSGVSAVARTVSFTRVRAVTASPPP